MTNRYLQNLDAEQAVIGACLIDSRAYWRVQEVGLSADHFTTIDHRQLWGAIDKLAKSGVTCDVITICEADPSINVTLPLEIAQATPGAANATAYARLVVNAALARNVAKTAQKVASIELPGDEAANEAMRLMQGVQMETRGETVQISVGVVGFIGELNARLEAESKMPGVSSGITALDAMTGGFEPGLIIIGARPSMGKSALALQIALTASVHRRERVFFASLEMDVAQLSKRAVSHVAGVSMGRFKDPGNANHGMRDEDWPRLTHAASLFRGAPLIISDRARQPAVQIAAAIRREHSIGGLKLAIVDYLGIMRFAGKPEVRRHDIGEACAILRQCAKDLGIPILLLSQLNRANEGRTNKRPTLSDLRESGDIEQDADLIILVHREDYYGDGGPSSEGIAELIVAKNRQGETGTVPTLWRGSTQTFLPYTGTWPIPVPEKNTGGANPFSRGKK